MNWLDILIFVGLSAFMLFLFFYMLRLEKAIEQKFAAIELSLEELNKDVFFLKKELKKDDVLKTIEKLETIIDNIVDDVRAIDERNKEYFKKIEAEIKKVSIDLKKNNLPNVSTLSKHEEEKVISMYKSGYSLEEISRKLRIPMGEIELILKFSDF